MWPMLKLTRIILARHGSTIWNESRRVQGGNHDATLNAEGERQGRCLAEKLRKEKIVAVSHHFVLTVILCAVMGIPAAQMGRFRINESSVSIVSFDPYGPFLSLFNDRCHLAT
jgi:broad specificity phosphatase PhoE